MKLHPLCKLFPEITDNDFAELVADVKANGLREPITTLDGQILDGQNRFNACTASGVKPQFDAFIGKDPVAFVISKNLSRRHLTESQRAMIAAALADESKSANLRITQEKAAKTLNVSTRSVSSAAKIRRGARSLARRVLDGKTSLHSAEKQLQPHRSTPLPNPVIPEMASSDDGGIEKVTDKIRAKRTITSAEFQRLLDELEKMIPVDGDHKKFGIIANKFVERQMNFSTEKKEFNPYAR